MDNQPQNRSDFLNPPQIRKHLMPEFPLSSPISEELTSPFDASDSVDPFASPEDPTVPEPTTKEDGDGNQDTHYPSRWSADSGSVKRTGRWSTTKRLVRANSKRASNKRGLPGLNLVTNFTSPSASTSRPRQVTNGAVDTRPREQNQDAKTFLDLNDLKALPRPKDQAKVKRDARRLLWKRAARKGYAELSDQSREVPQKPAGKKTHELSPSDRPIVIGMSLPSDPEEEDKSHNDGGATKNEEGANDQGSPQDDRTPVTPSIVITPARENRPWDAEPDNSSALLSRLRRPASSVYSQPTPRVKTNNRVESIPPVPALPASALFVKTDDSDDVFADNASISTRRQRAFSTGTVFEDDSCSPTPQDQRPRSLSNGANRQGMLSGLSLETIATRRRSQGWWNYLLSPLLSRSNTISSRTPQSAQSPPPPLPSARSLPGSSSLGEKGSTGEMSTFSPDTPETADREKSMRSDITSWPGWRSEAGRVTSISPKCMPEHKNSPSSAETSQTIPFMMSTPVTTHRCHACTYDSDTDPFFGSINHTCAADGIQSSPPSNNVAAGGTISNSNNRGVLAARNSNSNNPFFQRFVDSLRSDSTVRQRRDSVSTTFEDEPDISPTVREASVTPLFRADGTSLAPTPVTTTATPSQESSDNHATPAVSNTPKFSSQPPPYSPPHQHGVKGIPRYRAIFPGEAQSQQPHSPGPITPGAQNVISDPGGYSMSENPQRPPLAYSLPTNRQVDEHRDLPPRPPAAPVTLSAIAPEAQATNESRRQRLEREDAYGQKVGGLWRGRGCFSNNGCFGRKGREGRNRRRWYAIIAAVFIVIITLSVVLAITLTREGDPTPVESRWLNLTGYPPMPTGISTIAGPNIASSRSGCVRPATMWSCALPKEQHEGNKPFDPDRPNFRIQVDFENGTFSHSTAEVPNSDNVQRMLARRLADQKLKRGLADEASPAPPSLEDMDFLGNTTDNISAPLFGGEESPFFATFMSPAILTSSGSLRKRAEEQPPSSFPNLTSIIPPPELDSDGTAAATDLYPLPVSQPIRLFDRGLASEHYGFYTYFDRSIFLKSTQPLTPSSDGEDENVPDDLNGGSSKSAARVRCTWAQTRFLVQIWTQPQNAGLALVDPPDSSSPPPSATSSAPPSANDFTRPGSFPYPVTITLDRHGGVAEEKMVYCYGVDVRGQIKEEEKKLQLEFRDFGGTLVNPAAGLFNLTGEDEGATGDAIDGGTGGCRCEWRNWLAVS